MTDQDLLREVQFALVEPVDGGQSWTSDLWTRIEVLASLNERQRRFLKDTLAIVTTGTITPVGIGVSRLALPSDYLRLVSVVWNGNDGTIRELRRSDAFEADTAMPAWILTNATPLVYMEYDPEQLEIQIAPAPDVAGTLGLLYVAQGADLTGNGIDLTLPDEPGHALKYGVLADLLGKDGRGKDPGRAQYCEDRYSLAIDATRILLQGWS